MTPIVEYPDDCIKVLDHGFVKLVDCMGNDSSIVQAARVSYGIGTKTVHEDEGLIRYLMRHRHSTPFEMVEFKFLCRLPIFVARQMIRHRTASTNEMSGRYSEMPDLFYVPTIEHCTKQSVVNRQGGSDEVVVDASVEVTSFEYECMCLRNFYQSHLKSGMRKELARINLPLSQYTEWYWKIDLHNLFHFLKLRLDSHAQYEIRVYGEAIATYVKQVVPVAWKAFEDFQLNSVTFSDQELKTLKTMLVGGSVAWGGSSDKFYEGEFKTKRELEEFKDKLKVILGSNYESKKS